MTREQAIQLAVDAALNPAHRDNPGNVWCKWFSPLCKSDARPGWLVAIPSGMPKDCGAQEIYVRVFEPDGEVRVIPPR